MDAYMEKFWDKTNVIKSLIEDKLDEMTDIVKDSYFEQTEKVYTELASAEVSVYSDRMNLMIVPVDTEQDHPFEYKVSTGLEVLSFRIGAADLIKKIEECLVSHDGYLLAKKGEEKELYDNLLSFAEKLKNAKDIMSDE